MKRIYIISTPVNFHLSLMNLASQHLTSVSLFSHKALFYRQTLDCLTAPATYSIMQLFHPHGGAGLNQLPDELHEQDTKLSLFCEHQTIASDHTWLRHLHFRWTPGVLAVIPNRVTRRPDFVRTVRFSSPLSGPLLRVLLFALLSSFFTLPAHRRNLPLA